MAITHATVKAAGQKLFALADWNVNHIIGTFENNIIFAADRGIKTLVGARAYLTTTQSIPNLTWTKVNLTAEDYDLGGDFDTTNKRFVAPVSGYYAISGCVRYVAAVDNQFYRSAIVKNGNVANGLSFTVFGSAGIVGPGINISDINYLAAGDYVELWAYHNAGVAQNISDYYHAECYMSVFLLSVA